jgi:hypothetical protein
VNLGLPVSKIVTRIQEQQSGSRVHGVGTEEDHQLLVGLDHKRKGLTVAVGLGKGAVLDDVGWMISWRSSQREKTKRVGHEYIVGTEDHTALGWT